MIEILLHGLKMDPLVSLHYYAPVCAIINLAVLPFTEGIAPFYELARVGPLILLSNAFVAFLLNIAAVFLVGAGSGLVLTLAGAFKDILLITGSVLIFGSTITPLQVGGMSSLLPRRIISHHPSSCVQVTRSRCAVSSSSRPQGASRRSRRQMRTLVACCSVHARMCVGSQCATVLFTRDCSRLHTPDTR